MLSYQDSSLYREVSLSTAWSCAICWIRVLWILEVSMFLQQYCETCRTDLHLLFVFCGERSPRSVPDVENVHNMIAFVQRINDSVGAWFFPKKQMAKSLAFGDDCTSLRISF